MDIYQIEDLILKELRRMSGFQRVDDSDVNLVHFKGIINVGRLAKCLHDQLKLDIPHPVL